MCSLCLGIVPRALGIFADCCRVQRLGVYVVFVDEREVHRSRCATATFFGRPAGSAPR